MRRILIGILSLLLLGACKGDTGPVGPEGPAGPQGPVGPQGPGVSYHVTTFPISTNVIVTTRLDTGGVTPGVVCYVSQDATADNVIWVLWGGGDPSQGTCGVEQDPGGAYYGEAAFPDLTMIDSGWTVKIILFWVAT